MRFSILGILTVEHEAVQALIRRAQRRGLLAYLLMNGNHFVSVASLIEAMWGGAEPKTARQQIQTSVHALRVALRDVTAEEILVGKGSSYMVRLAEGQLDLADFENSLALARAALAEGRPEEAERRAEAGLKLWRGPALADASGAFVEAARASLDDQHAAATEELFEARLRLGRHETVAEQARTVIVAHPRRERLLALYLRALYRCGQKVAALEAYRQFRRNLVEEQGLEPGPELRALERMILLDDRALQAPAPAALVTVSRPPAVPAQLPTAQGGFVGREDALASLDRLLATGASRPVLISSIDGLAGVGKTALALQWAHKVRQSFPDGQLYLDLRGYSTAPAIDPLTALTRFLISLGVAPQRVPSDLESAAALYRSTLAGRRMLVVLDNAHDATQVRPLLTAEAQCLTVITSRESLTGLVARDGARRLNLQVLSPQESLLLLSDLIGTPRVSAEPAAAAAIARICSHLPLALRITGARLHDRAHVGLADYLATLRAAPVLDQMEVDADPHTSVRWAIELSYVALPAATRRIFRLLGLAPGPDITLSQVTALAGCDPQESATAIERLQTCGFVNEREPGRFAMHDLIGDYARERAELEEPATKRRDAVDRLHRHLLASIDAAARVLYPQVVRLPTETGPFEADHTQTSATQWVQDNLQVIVAAVLQAGQLDSPACWLLADAVRGFFWIRRPMAEWMATAEVGLAAALRVGDSHGAAAMHISLGVALRCRSEHAQALPHLREALRLAQHLAWVEQEASVLGNLAVLHAELGENAAAIEHLTRSREIYAGIGRWIGEAVVLNNLGTMRMNIGDYAGADRDMTDALRLYRKAGAPGGVAIALTNLGIINNQRGRIDEASQMMAEGLKSHDELGDRYGGAFALMASASLHRERGDLAAAESAVRASLEVAEEHGDRRLETGALSELAAVLGRRGELNQAVAVVTRALDVARADRNPYGEIEAGIRLAELLFELDSPDEALRHALSAAEHARRYGYSPLEGDALTAAGWACMRAGDVAAAAAHADAALANHDRSGRRLAAARAIALRERVEACRSGTGAG